MADNFNFKYVSLIKEYLNNFGFISTIEEPLIAMIPTETSVSKKAFLVENHITQKIFHMKRDVKNGNLITRRNLNICQVQTKWMKSIIKQQIFTF